ncbi:MAG: hypothetical protein AABY22_18910 [Nanoarchaeota archaeon]
MSGVSEQSTCPICQNQMDVYVDWKPLDYSISECIYCGFYLEPKVGQMTLKEVNNMRAEYNENTNTEDKLKPLTQKDLDKYSKDIKTFW